MGCQMEEEKTESPVDEKQNAVKESRLASIRCRIKAMEMEIEKKRKTFCQFQFPALETTLEKLRELEEVYGGRKKPTSEICEICGGLQDVARERKNSHVKGKLHQ